jgi:hypothetical protein
MKPLLGRCYIIEVQPQKATAAVLQAPGGLSKSGLETR